MNEFALIQAYFNRPSQLPSVVQSVGDDCAILNIPNHQQLVMSIDTLVEGVHFLPDTDPALIAERAIHVAVSDLAAMGASPQWLTLALTLPSASDDWLAKFSAGFFAAANYYGMDLIGGDTTRGALTISVQVHGFVERDSALLRSSAQSGDSIYVTGTLGDGAAGLAVLQGELKTNMAAKEYLLNRYYRPTAQIIAGKLIKPWVNAAIDISDGLLADLGHICRGSDLVARIDESLLPYSDALLSSSAPEQCLQWALTGGDDYQLCFTVSQKHKASIDHLIETSQLNATCIGEMCDVNILHGNTETHLEKNAVLSAKTHEPFVVKNTGYVHF